MKTRLCVNAEKAQVDKETGEAARQAKAEGSARGLRERDKTDRRQVWRQTLRSFHLCEWDR